MLGLMTLVRCVSIPSSSGQYFQQGKGKRLHVFIYGFNPFFIRAILPTLVLGKRLMQSIYGFNPFFIRAILPTPRCRRHGARAHYVSIPSSSGQYFQHMQCVCLSGGLEPIGFNPFFIRAILPTSSMCSVGTSTASGRFNPFFIRAILPTVDSPNGLGISSCEE